MSCRAMLAMTHSGSDDPTSHRGRPMCNSISAAVAAPISTPGCRVTEASGGSSSPPRRCKKTHVVVAQLSKRERVVGIQLCDAALNGGDFIQLDQERNIAPLCRVSDAQPAAPCR